MLDTLTAPVQQAFDSVFQGVNATVEAWFQQTKLLTTGRQNYVRYMVETVGRFALFGVNRTVSVDDSYVTVAISSDLERLRYKTTAKVSQQMQSAREVAKLAAEEIIGVRPIDAINSTTGVFALVGNAGSGKTTAFRHLAIEVAKGIQVRGAKRLAVFLPIRDLDKRSGVSEAIASFLGDLGVDASREVSERLLQAGKLAVFLDGLDETDVAHQDQLLRDLSRLAAKHPSAVFCISARPYTVSLGSAAFSMWETMRLQLPQRLAFVRKWFAAVDPGKGERFLETCRETPAVLDLGSSPLLLSIVCALYYNDLDVPTDHEELYSRAVEGLLGGWDAFRNIARRTPLSKLTIRRRVVLMSWLAAGSFELKKTAFTADDVHDCRLIERVKSVLRVDLPDEDTLLQCLYNDFGILVERAPDIYAFSHLTLHEYLAAVYVLDNRMERQLIAGHIHDQEWFNVIKMVAKMLPRAEFYMCDLSDAVSLSNRYEVMLLKSSWDTRPMCNDVQVRFVMQRLYDRAAPILAEWSFDLSRVGDALGIGVRHLAKDALENADLSETCACLSDVLTILLSRDIRFAELVSRPAVKNELWDALAESGLRRALVIPPSQIKSSGLFVS